MRIVASLALLYVFRMLGLFMVLPILMIYGGVYQGASPFLLGLALGVYGLTQACFQIPLGALSDVIGRKPVIIIGLIVFAVGSVIAATSQSVEGLIIGRALQGSGAIASAIMAMVADLTTEENRTKAMAAIGASIGLSFTVAMVLGPAVAATSGISGVFFLAAVLALAGIFVILFAVPTPNKIVASKDVSISPQLFRDIAKNGQLNRLNFGIFSLHAILMISFVGLPSLVENVISLDKASHWKFYLPVLLVAFVCMLPFMVLAERKRKVKPVFLAAVAVLGISNALLILYSQNAILLIFTVFLFFVAFNLLESLLPSLVSKISPAGAKGTAMGMYSTSQFLGAFCGGTIGGYVMQFYPHHIVFVVSAVLAVLWFGFARNMAAPKHLSSLCIAVKSPEYAQQVSSIEGVVEVYHSEDESLLYLKVDRDTLDETAFNEVKASVAG